MMAVVAVLVLPILWFLPETAYKFKKRLKLSKILPDKKDTQFRYIFYSFKIFL